MTERRAQHRARAISKGLAKSRNYCLGGIGFTLLVMHGISASQMITVSSLSAKAHPTLWALVVVGLFYSLLALSLRGFYSGAKQSEQPGSKNSEQPGSWWRWWDPAVVSAGEYGTASISSLQLLWFTLIVGFMAIKSLYSAKGLPGIPTDVLLLLGSPAASKVASVVISSSRLRLSLDNWNWLLQNKFLKAGNTIDPRDTAGWKDLIITDGVFDPARFQLFLSGFLIGFAMLLGDDMSKFTIGSWNNILIGSNVIYLGGKALSPTAIKELDERVTIISKKYHDTGTIADEDKAYILRSLESAYGKNVLDSCI